MTKVFLLNEAGQTNPLHVTAFAEYLYGILNNEYIPPSIPRSDKEETEWSVIRYFLHLERLD